MNDLSDASLDELARATAELAAAQARQLRALAALQNRPPKVARPGFEEKHWVRDEVACILACAPDYAGHRLMEAALLSRHSAIVDQLGTGDVTMGHVRAVADALTPLDERTADQVAARVLPVPPGQSVGRLRSALRRAVLAMNPPNEERERAANVAERRVRIRPYGAGVSSLWALLPEADAAAVASAVNVAATGEGSAAGGGSAGGIGAASGDGDAALAGDPRTADQRRADALVALVLRGSANSADPAGVNAADPAGTHAAGADRRPLIQVSVALSTLLGIDDQPADLEGVGAIPAALARRLAADPSGTWRRLITDPAGRLIDYGRRTYRPPVALADHVTARDRTCRFPHCNRPATASEVDHRIAWADGGQTNADNLHVLCSRHHHLKDETRWQVRSHPDGSTEWFTPHGRRHITPAPELYPIDHTGSGSAAPEVQGRHPAREPDPPF